jgi:hypothetical protein
MQNSARNDYNMKEQGTSQTMLYHDMHRNRHVLIQSSGPTLPCK